MNLEIFSYAVIGTGAALDHIVSLIGLTIKRLVEVNPFTVYLINHFPTWMIFDLLVLYLICAGCSVLLRRGLSKVILLLLLIVGAVRITAGVHALLLLL